MASIVDISFAPPASEFAVQRSNARYTALTGVNNSGKSTYLKGLWAKYGDTDTGFVPVSRFVSTIPMQRQPGPPTMQYPPGYRSQTLYMSPENSDHNPFDLPEMIRQMADKDRDRLFEIAQKWINVKFELKRTNPASTYSDLYLDSDDAPFEIASTGSRLLFTILAFCSDSRYTRVLIDEPELGLSPDLQAILSDAFTRDDKRQEFFPHLKHVLVATHSHLFLDRIKIDNNFIAEKRIEGGRTHLTMRGIEDLSTFHDVQLRLMGNSLSSFFMPEVIIVVEGKTDLPYLKKIIDRRFPNHSIAVIDTNGTPKEAVNRLNHVLAGLSRTPYSRRLFVVFDKIFEKSQEDAILKHGVPREHIIKWEKNGIEYLYPTKEMETLFRGSLPDDDFVSGDVVSIRGIEYKKAELNAKICSMISADTVIPDEIETKLIKPMRAAIERP